MVRGLTPAWERCPASSPPPVQGTAGGPGHGCWHTNGPHPAQVASERSFDAVTGFHLEEREQEEPPTFHVIEVSRCISLEM